FHSLWWYKIIKNKNSALYDNLMHQCFEKSENNARFIQASRLCLWQTSTFAIFSPIWSTGTMRDKNEMALYCRRRCEPGAATRAGG
ncbi:hypothetical protein ACWM1Q_09085, partial [Klebsiella grimontii]